MSLKVEHVNPEFLASTLEHGFSQIITVTGGTTVYISGQVPWNHAKEIVGENDFNEQVKQCLRNIDDALSAVGATASNVVKMRIYVVELDAEKISIIEKLTKDYFPVASPPTSVLIGVHKLAEANALVEFDIIAIIP